MRFLERHVDSPAVCWMYSELIRLCFQDSWVRLGFRVVEYVKDAAGIYTSRLRAAYPIIKRW
jgi:hypothetical protein